VALLYVTRYGNEYAGFIKAENFFASSVTFGFSRETVLHGAVYSFLGL
jgi:hypothetical protein